MAVEFIYFDIGNVLLRFDNRRACAQVATLFNRPTEEIWQAWFGSPLALDYEAGRIETAELFEWFCQKFTGRPERAAFDYAASAIFELNSPVKTIAAQLASAGYRLGLLSNTNELHWNYFTDGRYELLPRLFEVHALSFRLKLLKPEREIYEQAAAMAGVRPQNIFYTDDIPANVAGAREAGFDAVPFTTPWQLADDLRARGLRFNY